MTWSIAPDAFVRFLPVLSRHTVAEYLDYWIREVVKPGMKPKPAETYEMHVRLYLEPELGKKRLDKLTVRDIRSFFNRMAVTCQCCAQGKDAARPAERQKCCSIGQCCQQTLSRATLLDIRKMLRVALNNAILEELIIKNPCGVGQDSCRSQTAGEAVVG